MPASRASSCDRATKLAPVSTSMRTRLPSSVGWTTKWPRRSAETTTRLPLSAPAANSAFSLDPPRPKSDATCSLAEVAESTVEMRIPEAQTIGRAMKTARKLVRASSCGRENRPLSAGSPAPGFGPAGFRTLSGGPLNAVMRQDAREARDQRRLGRNGVDRDAVAGERAGEQRDPSLIADGGDALGLGEEGKSAVDLVAGEKPRDIRAQLLRRHPSGHGRCAGAEDEVQEPDPPPGQAAIALGGVETTVEAGRVLRLGRRPADHRVVAQERIHLAGEIGREPFDSPGLHLDPFRVRARQADQPVRDACPEAERLLAAHDVDRARIGLAEKPRDDVALAAAFDLDLDHGAGDFLGARRTWRIGRHAPALAASDHADERDRRLRLARQPIAAVLEEDLPVLPFAERRDALVRGHPVDDRLAVDHEGPEAGRAPVDQDEAHRQRVPYIRSPASPRPGTM